MNAHAGRPPIAAEDILDAEKIADIRQWLVFLTNFVEEQATISYESEIYAALAVVAERCGYAMAPLDDDDDETVDIEIDGAELDEALARARCGQVEDCAIHLGRALPHEYAAIADRLGDAARGGR
jgi:hypothetical protein